MTLKNKLVLIVAGIVVVTIPLLLFTEKPMIFDANIPLSTEADNLPLVDQLETIHLTFPKKLDPNTLNKAIKLATINAQGEASETKIQVAADPKDEKSLFINLANYKPFISGEAYQLQIDHSLKAKNGISMGADYSGYFASNYDYQLSGRSDLEAERSQILIISDLHLGIDDAFSETVENRQPLIDFLNQVKESNQVKELVIAGDFFDGWFMPMDYSIPTDPFALVDQLAANNQGLVDAVNAIIAGGQIKVTYVPGNHDLLFTDADYRRIFPGMDQARDKQGLGTYITGNQAEIAIEHGHRANIFCAPDPLSNQMIAKDSILPPGYFFTRIAASSLTEGQPKNTSNVFPEINTPDKSDPSQFNAYLYYQTWKNILSVLPVNERFSDPVIKTNIDGFTDTYAADDLLPHQDNAGFIDMNLYSGIQDRWEQTQDLNEVTTKVPVSEAILRAASSSFTDDMAQVQYFDVDASKRIVVFGHSHVGLISPETNLQGQKTIYANSGTWIDDNTLGTTMTFVVITPPKPDSAIETVNFYQYANDGRVTQWGAGQAIIL